MKDIDIDRIDEYSLAELQNYIQTMSQKPVKKIKVNEGIFILTVANTIFALVGVPVTLVEYNIRSYWWGIPIFFGWFLAGSLLEFVGARVYEFFLKHIEFVDE